MNQHEFKIHESWRVFRIMSEFVDALELMKDVDPAVSIFGSARFDPGNRWYEMARELASRLSHAGFSIITGGGPGIMEAGTSPASADASPVPSCPPSGSNSPAPSRTSRTH
jgi:predicted Rossmann-fold nucleotide-binding protein